MIQRFFSSSFLLLISLCFSFCASVKEAHKRSEFEAKLQLEELIRADLKSVFDTEFLYKYISFSKSIAMRPNSFYLLDSMYVKKMQNDKKRKEDPFLDDAIEAQRILARKDKDQVRYKIEHLFQLIDKKNNKTEYCNSYYIFNDADSILESKITERFVMQNGLGLMFEKYMKEDALTGVNAPDSYEKDFYKMYKKKVNSLKGDNQDLFLQHTLLLMQSLSKEYVRSMHINYMVLPWINSILNEQTKTTGYSELEDLQENFETKEGLDYSTGYTARVKYEYKSETWQTVRYNITMDTYLQVLSQNEIKE